MNRIARQAVILLAATATLGACASSAPAPRPRAADVARQPTLSFPRAASGTVALIGATARTLIAQFGQPALDIPEGRARKLQFSGAGCVLDAYLYPQRGRGEPVVTHVDARLPDGRDTERNACAEALRRR